MKKFMVLFLLGILCANSWAQYTNPESFGYEIKGEKVLFTFDVKHCLTTMEKIPKVEKVEIYLNFAPFADYIEHFDMKKVNNLTYTFEISLKELGNEDASFKFFINDSFWVEPPQNAKNIMPTMFRFQGYGNYLWTVKLPETHLTSKESFELSGDFKGIPDNTHLFIGTKEGKFIADAFTKNGKFHLAKKLTQPALGYLFYDMGEECQMNEIALENANYVVKGNYNPQTKELESVVWEGGALQVEHIAYLAEGEKIDKFQQEKSDSLRMPYEIAKRNKDTAMIRKLDILFEENKNWVLRSQRTLFDTKKNSLLGLLYLHESYANTFYADTAMLILKTFSPDLQQSSYAKHVEEVIKNAKTQKEGKYYIESGKAFEYLSLPNEKGEKIKLSNFKGKWLVIDCWATWCGACIQQIPNFEEVVTNEKYKNVNFVSVSLDDDMERWKTFVKEHHLKNLQLIDLASSTQKAWDTYIYPTYLIISPEGKIVWRGTRFSGLETALDFYLAK